MHVERTAVPVEPDSCSKWSWRQLRAARVITREQRADCLANPAPWFPLPLLLFSSSVVSDPLQPHGLRTPGFPVFHYLPESAQIHVHWLGDAIQPSHSLSSLFSSCPQSFPASGFFPESALHTRWPKHWSFSFSISPSNDYSGLISFRMDWFDSLAVQGTLKSLLQHHSLKASVLWRSASLRSSSHTRTRPVGEPQPWLYAPFASRTI